MRCEINPTDSADGLATSEPTCDEILGNLVELGGLFIGGRVPNLHFVEFARSIELRAPSTSRGSLRSCPPVMFLRRRAA